MQAPIILSTGALLRYAVSRSHRFATRSVTLADLSQQTAGLLAASLRGWELDLGMLRDSEREDWLEFFESAQGAKTAFTFVDPLANLLKWSEEFDNAVWVKSNLTAAADLAAVDPFDLASGRVQRLTVSATPASMYQEIAVTPSGAGSSRKHSIEFTLSLWIKLVASGPTSFDISIGDDASESSLLSVTPTATLTRVSLTYRFAASNDASNVRARLDNFSGTGQVLIFGAQLEAVGTVSGYKKTGARSGVVPNCRFAEDEIEFAATKYDHNDMRVTIREWAG